METLLVCAKQLCLAHFFVLLFLCALFVLSLPCRHHPFLAILWYHPCGYVVLTSYNINVYQEKQAGRGVRAAGCRQWVTGCG
jgi:hypothetical protein